MKKTLLFSISFIACTLSSFAQESKSDSIKFKLGTYNVLLTPNKDTSTVEVKKVKKQTGSAHWEGLDLGVNVLSSSQSSFDLTKKDAGFNVNPAKSLYWALNLFEGYLPISKHNFGIVSGLGFAFKSYSFYSNNELVQNKDTAYTVTNATNYSKNKLRNFYGQIPVLLSFNSSDDNKKNFHVSAGVIGNVLLNSVYKLEYEVNGELVKEKRKTSNPLQIISADATVRVGFNNFTLFASSPLQTFFREGRSANLYGYTFGVRVIGF